MYSQTYASSWQYGYQQVVNYVKSVYSDYDQILITKKYGEPHEFFLFYWPWPPHQYHTDPAKVWDYHANWYWIDKFDKFRFINDWDILTVTQSLPSDQNILLITSPHNYNPKIFKKIKTINFLDNNPAFDILSYE